MLRADHLRNTEEIEAGGWFAPEKITQWVAERPEEFARAFVLIWKRITAATK